MVGFPWRKIVNQVRKGQPPADLKNDTTAAPNSNARGDEFGVGFCGSPEVSKAEEEKGPPCRRVGRQAGSRAQGATASRINAFETDIGRKQSNVSGGLTLIEMSGCQLSWLQFQIKLTNGRT